MSFVFITGSTQGLGRATAQNLIEQGHQVVLHARSPERLAAVKDLIPQAAGVVIGDLSRLSDIRLVAEQVNQIGRMNAVIHNAGVYPSSGKKEIVDGYPSTFMVNTVAPYLLTALIQRPERLIYLSSSMHFSGVGDIHDIDWHSRPWNASEAYSESKLFVTALSFAIARYWPNVLSHAVDPGWVPTRMGGKDAPDDLIEGYLTQCWLAVSNDDAVRISGRYWHHHECRKASSLAYSSLLQDNLIDKLSVITNISLF